jgi:L-threonylcarbamoyladenylate synthase
MDSPFLAAPTDANLDRAVTLLQQDELVGVPTETVYGLAANATSAAAVAKVYAAKNRPANNPLILHVASAADARRWCQIDQHAWIADQFDCASQFWPGPLTIVVPGAPGISSTATAGGDSVGIRVPNHSVALALLQRCDFPLAAPSANPSNYISPTTAQHVAHGMGDRVRMILDGGACTCGVESTIIKLNESGPTLLRAGGVSVEALQDAFGCSIDTSIKRPDAKHPMPSPGQFQKHYSPTKPLLICGLDAIPETTNNVGRIAFAPLSDSDAASFQRVWTLSRDGDLGEVARNLFAALRDADQSDVELILIDACGEDGIGKAIMDRINRASSRS